MIKLIDQYVSKLAIAAVVGGVLLAQPVLAADAPAAAAPAAVASASAAPAKTESAADRVEARIKALHDKLNVTADQQSQWDAVAKVMRANEEAIHKLAEARHDNDSATAIDDLKSYKEIADAHAAGLAKLIPAFEALYGKMSTEQKANADKVFGTFEGHDHKAPAAK